MSTATMPATECLQVDWQVHDETDDVLVEQTLAGRTTAFGMLVERHQSRIYGIACRQLGDAALARDITQNTFISLYENLGSYRRQGGFRAYLTRIAVNQCRMTARTRWFSKRTMLTLADSGSQAPRELSRDLERALGRLSDKLRIVVVLYYVGGLTSVEIAEALDVPIGTVKRRLFDALVKLRGCLEAP